MFAPAVTRLILVLLLLLAASSTMTPAAAQVDPGERAYWPTAGWRTAAPEAQGMDPALLAQLAQRVPAELPLLSGLVVVRGGDIVFEDYNGQTADEPIHLWSVTKSVTSMAVGMAVAEGLLRLDQTLGELIPERIPEGADPRTASMTVEQLLTMTSGWAWDSSTDFLHLDDAPDWAARTLGLPMACDPGECYEYNSGNAHLLSVLVQTVTGQAQADYLQGRLFDPLGIARPTWGQSPQGETAGAFALELNPRAVAKLGYLYLNQGVWDGRQIVPSEWVATSTTEHSSGTSPSGVNLGQAGYGYLWWVTEVAGYPAYFALGYGSQVLYVVPGLDLVAVAMVAEPNTELQQNPIPLIEELVVPAALAAPSAAVAAAPAVAQATGAPEASPTSLPAVAAATPVPGGRVFALPGGGGFPEGIAYDEATGDFYTGSAIDGTIYRGNVESGEVAVFLPGQPGRVALGLALDQQGRLYVAGGETGFVAVYDTASGQRLAEIGNGLAPNTFLNDVAVTPDGSAYITDSFNPVLWRLPATALPAGAAPPVPGLPGGTPVEAAAPLPSGTLELVLDLSASPVFLAEGFDANGIVATPDGQYLLIVQSNTGALYRIDIASGEVSQVDLGGAVLSGGSGLALDGQTLSVVTGEAVGAGEAITLVTLAADFLSGGVRESVTDPTFAAPTSLARYDGCLLVVNSQLDRLEGEPALPFTVSSVPIPVAGGATPTPAVSC
jgi:CubicO group peptidase (beta-lactamase class C family)/sugar lactone lactonase YvrE